MCTCDVNLKYILYYVNWFYGIIIEFLTIYDVIIISIIVIEINKTL